MRRASAAGKSTEDQTDEDQKVIVRSNGTVGYVGKDIAFHMWKFGLLTYPTVPFERTITF